MRATLPATIFSLLILLLPTVTADPVSLPFEDCFDEPESENQKFQVNTVYAQVLQNNALGNYLNLTVLGTSPKDILGLTNTSTSLSTLFTSTSVLTLSAWSNSSYLCQTMRPPSPLPSAPSKDGTFCPLSAGPFAFSSTIPWGQNRELTTLITRLRAVDPFSKELLCIDVQTIPLAPRPNSPYGKAVIIFWATVALTIAYWVIVGLARIASAWGRGITRPGRGVWARAQSAGYILASAISGERLAGSPALMRFCTPSIRDIIFHTQWCAVLVMVAVEWPQSVYPLLKQTAWSTLSYNISLTDSSEQHHWNPVNTTQFSPPSGFASQLSDNTSPLFIDPTVPNNILSLPSDATPGMSTFAYTLGVRPQDLFPNCLILFLGIIGATIVLSFLFWLIDYAVSSIVSSSGQSHSNALSRLGRAKSPAFGVANKELGESAPNGAAEESKSLTGSGSIIGPGTATSAKFPTTRFGIPLSGSGVSSERGINSHRSWWRLRSDIGAFHGSVLHGNLVRILVLFHLPVTVFSCYQMTMPRSMVGTTPIVLAALSFIIFSILIPAHLVIRVAFTTTNKLYDETKTLLSLGPLYNHYRHGSQLFAVLFFATNIAFGVTIGAGQKSGTAQAIIILVIEVISALVTSIWLPWGSGASMGLISFLFCVARIVIAVLLVILTPAISIGSGPGGWVSYGILVILALVYLALLIMLVGKVLEGLIRLFGGVGFDRSKRVMDSGLIGALGLLGCCGGPRKRHRRRSHRPKTQIINPTRARTRDSDLSSYTPPVGGIVADGTATPPHFLHAGSRQGSTHSQQPPSVLKPEQANRPYKEELADAEDEGYIMGAWQPFPPRSATGYTPVSDSPRTTPPNTLGQTPKITSPATSGFSRVGGGRAHIDSPYAINAGGTGSTHAFPSLGQQSQNLPSASAAGSSRTAVNQPLFYQHPGDSTEDVPLSLSNVETAVGVNGLPPGAMQPAHIRTKSQTAIVEDYMPTLQQSSSSGLAALAQEQSNQSLRQKHVSQDTFLKAPVTAPSTTTKFTLGADGDDDDSGGEEQDQQRKKKPWYHLRRNRPHSSEGRTSTSASTTDLAASRPVDEEMGGIGPSGSGEPSTTPQRSFVVIRKPPGSVGRASQLGGGSSPGPSAYPSSSSRPPTR